MNSGVGGIVRDAIGEATPVNEKPEWCGQVPSFALNAIVKLDGPYAYSGSGATVRSAIG
jgi:hypothetical protein